MAVIIKNLANGTPANSTAVSHQPGIGKAWIVKNVMLTNSHGTTACTIDLKAVSRFIAPPGMTIGPKSTVVLNDEITLTGSGEALSIAVTAGSPNLDYVVNGVERDA